MKLKVWIEAMRLRTLPVSLAGVIAALGYASLLSKPDMAVFILCLVFALLAQIASNFANEYFDFKAGLDAPGREGPRRGVTEGDITPRNMKFATFGMLGAACTVGLTLIYWGGWPILFFGVLIAAGVLAYSTGPFPFSRRCLGEVSVIVFFGLAPVCLTFYLMEGYVDPYVWSGAVAIGLMGANVLLVNNIRDRENDKKVRKYTLVVVLGRRAGSFFYLFNGWVAVWLMGSVWLWIGNGWLLVPMSYAIIHTLLWYRVDLLSQRAAFDKSALSAMNPCLGMTACLMAAYAVLFAIAA